MNIPEDDLFAHARKSDPPTSHQAAASVKRIKDSQWYIHTALKAFGPMTDEEILPRIEGLGCKISASGARTRRKELVDIGLVFDTGSKKLTKSGRRTIVWDAT